MLEWKNISYMKQQRIYIDTSIVGGFFDAEFEKETKLLFQRLENKIEIRNPKDLVYGKGIWLLKNERRNSG